MFGEVHDVEFDTFGCSALHARVINIPEEEPLVVASSVGVHAHIEIIIRIMPPHNHIEVATLEVRIKRQGVFHVRPHAVEGRRVLSSLDVGEGNANGWKREVITYVRQGLTRSLVAESTVQFVSVGVPLSIEDDLHQTRGKFFRFFKHLVLVIQRDRSS